MPYRPSVIAALLALLATPVSAGNVIDPYTLFPATGGSDFPVVAGATYTESETGTLVLTPDTTVPEGQFIAIACFSTRPYGGVSFPENATDGFTNNVPGFAAASGAPGAAFWSKVAGPSEPAQYTFTVPSNARPWGCTIMRITGATGFDVAATQASGTNTTPIPVPTATTTQANTLVLRGAVTYLTATLTDSNGLDEITDQYISTEGNIFLGSETQAGVGATGAIDFTPDLARAFASFTVAVY